MKNMMRNILDKIKLKLGIPLFSKKEMKVIRDAFDIIEKEESDKDVAN